MSFVYHPLTSKQCNVPLLPSTVNRICLSVNIFALFCYRNLMSDVEYAVLSEWHDWLYDNAATGIDLIG